MEKGHNYGGGTGKVKHFAWTTPAGVWVVIWIGLEASFRGVVFSIDRISGCARIPSRVSRRNRAQAN
jgi:hypothetical protein